MAAEYVDVGGRKVSLHRNRDGYNTIAVVPCKSLEDYFTNSPELATSISDNSNNMFWFFLSGLGLAKKNPKNRLRDVFFVDFDISNLRITRDYEETVMVGNTTLFPIFPDIMPLFARTPVKRKYYELEEQDGKGRILKGCMYGSIQDRFMEPEDYQRGLSFRGGDIVDVRVDPWDGNLAKIHDIRSAGEKH